MSVSTFTGAKSIGPAIISDTTGSPTVDTSSRPGKTIYKFTGSGSITVPIAGYAEMLLIGGGGSGASKFGGGGKSKQHEVKVVDYTSKSSGKTAKYVSTSAFDCNGEVAKGLFLRVEAIDQAIADLQAAKAMLSKK
jgi:hypothetical protein